jgi:hypothetical protein
MINLWMFLGGDIFICLGWSAHFDCMNPHLC